MMPTEAKKAGRPKYNVYAERRKEKLIKRGETSAVIKQGRGLPLPFARKLVLQQAISWRRHHKTGQYHGQRFAWSLDWERRPNICLSI